MAQTIYKIVPETLWREGEARGAFAGASIDLTDGYIHFSTIEHVEETAAKHFAGQDGLLLVAIDPDALGSDLKYEPSRGGALFPHLYGKLPHSAVKWIKPLPVDKDGSHIFPTLEA